MSLANYLNKVTEGDCLELMKVLPSQTIDMILCDLPYGYTNNERDQIIDLEQLWEQYERIIKPSGVIALAASLSFTARLIMSNLEMFRYKIVWIKSKSTNFLNARKQPLRRHEDICIFYGKQPSYFPQMMAGAPYNKGVTTGQPTGCYGKFGAHLIQSDGPRFPYDVVFYDEAPITDWVYCKTPEHETPKPVHPSQKPVELGRYLIRTFTSPGQIVLDNACGSGAFLVAAIREGREFIGMEKNANLYRLKYQPINMVDYCEKRIAAELKNKSP